MLHDDWRSVGRQGRLLFAILAAEHRQSIRREELAEELWPESPPPSWDKTMNAIISKLRTHLGNIGSGIDLVSSFGCYQLRFPPKTWIDFEAAAEGLDRAEGALRAGEPKEAWGWAQVACHIARRPFLVGDEGPWAVRTRSRILDILVRSHECLSEIFVGTGETSTAARHARLAISLEPFRETAYQHLMRAQAAAGNRADALLTYEQCRRLLADELGVSPSSQTESVYSRILQA